MGTPLDASFSNVTQTSNNPLVSSEPSKLKKDLSTISSATDTLINKVRPSPTPTPLTGRGNNPTTPSKEFKNYIKALEQGVDYQKKLVEPTIKTERKLLITKIAVTAGIIAGLTLGIVGLIGVVIFLPPLGIGLCVGLGVIITGASFYGLTKSFSTFDHSDAYRKLSFNEQKLEVLQRTLEYFKTDNPYNKKFEEFLNSDDFKWHVENRFNKEIKHWSSIEVRIDKLMLITEAFEDKLRAEDAKSKIGDPEKIQSKIVAKKAEGKKIQKDIKKFEQEIKDIVKNNEKSPLSNQLETLENETNKEKQKILDKIKLLEQSIEDKKLTNPFSEEHSELEEHRMKLKTLEDDTKYERNRILEKMKVLNPFFENTEIDELRNKLQELEDEINAYIDKINYLNDLETKWKSNIQKLNAPPKKEEVKTKEES